MLTSAFKLLASAYQLLTSAYQLLVSTQVLASAYKVLGSADKVLAFANQVLASAYQVIASAQIKCLQLLTERQRISRCHEKQKNKRLGNRIIRRHLKKERMFLDVDVLICDISIRFFNNYSKINLTSTEKEVE